MLLRLWLYQIALLQPKSRPRLKVNLNLNERAHNLEITHNILFNKLESLSEELKTLSERISLSQNGKQQPVLDTTNLEAFLHRLDEQASEAGFRSILYTLGDSRVLEVSIPLSTLKSTLESPQKSGENKAGLLGLQEDSVGYNPLREMSLLSGEIANLREKEREYKTRIAKLEAQLRQETEWRLADGDEE